MKTEHIDIISCGKKNSTHVLSKLNETKKIVRLKAISFSDYDVEAKFLILLQTTEDSPDHFEDIILKLDETSSTIPMFSFDLSNYQLEVVVIPLILANESEEIVIRIEYDRPYLSYEEVLVQQKRNNPESFS